MSGVVVGWTGNKALAEKCLPRDQAEHPHHILYISKEPGKVWGSDQDTVYVIRGKTNRG